MVVLGSKQVSEPTHFRLRGAILSNPLRFGDTGRSATVRYSLCLINEIPSIGVLAV